ncbi:MAG: DUF4832 domain-containing protein [Dehalococcoidia bacterium]|nr:DUF4832 domain-containing protein [Dehalococcoidia bacterium]
MDIDYALLADHAEVVSGKLYLMGGGWDTRYVKETPVQVRLAVAIGVRVGWDETNRPTPVRIAVEDDDGESLVRAEASVNVGRPPHLAPGSTQLTQFALTLPVTLAKHGGYRVLITAGEGPGAVERILPFRAAPPRP